MPEIDVAGRVLVVDDEDRIRNLIERILRRNQYETATASDGNEALLVLAQREFDLLISDLRMPGMDGLALLAECRSRYPQMDVMILTGYGSIQSAVEAIKLGASEYMTKPFGVSELQQKVNKCLDTRRSRQARGLDSPLRPLVELHRILSRAGDAQESLEAIVELIHQVFAPDAIELYLFATEEDEGLGEPVLSQGIEPGDGWLRLDREEVEDLARHSQKWLLWDNEGVSAGPEESGLCVTVPLMSAGGLVGALTLYRRRGSPRFMRPDAELLEVFGFQIGLAMLQMHTRDQLTGAFRNGNDASLSAVEALFQALGTYDQYTHDHSERVSRYARQLGARIGLKNGELDQLTIGGLLHDVGKLGIGEGNLRKNGTLTDDEFDRVKLHPTMGAQILQGIKPFARVIPLVLYHHERLNGSGYPEGLVGESIPLGAQILAVVDSYDSMVTDRPYRMALDLDEAITRLRQGAGAEFNERLVEEWVEIVSAGEAL